MTTKLLIVVLLGLLLNSCASPLPTMQQSAIADYGSPISQDDAQSKAKVFFDNYLKDPFSAQFQWGTVSKGWLREAPINGGKIVYGYVLEVKANAKNSFGAYEGYKLYKFVFFNGTIKTIYGQKELQPGYNYMGKIY